GWLKGTSSAEFSQTLNYEEGSRYNGDITSVNWTLAGSSKTFSYSYDPLNRLTSGTSPDMSENNISYDNLGNLLSMTRDGKTLGYDYTYDGARGNRLNAVSGTWFNGTKYFRYDANGNVTRDDSRGISSISYNHLNLPLQVSSASGTLLSYSYTATGEKLRSYNSKTGTTTDYVGGTRYENNDLKVVLTEEGQLRRSGNSYSYEYWVKDHLGNTRVAFYRNPTTGQLEVLQREDYYPFGLNKVRGSLSSSKTNYLYNGKELQEGFDLLDYGARFYDVQTGRWTSLDPSAENDPSLSPYIYGFNNPVRFTDPDGKWPDDDGPDQMTSASIGAALGSVIVNAKLSLQTLAYNMGDLVGITPAGEGKKWEAQQEFSKSEGRYVTVMRQVPREGLVNDMLSHVGDGLNATAAVASFTRGTTSSSFFAKSGQEQAGTNAVSQTLKKGLTEPTLPPKTIAESDGVKIVHYTRSGDHGPPHAHVMGGGKETKIGQAGRPIKGSPELTKQQADVISQYKAEIRKAIDKIGRWFNYNRQ
ncbi:RHS repeat domain-containing protein, partial [Pararcticibacter amylolyticus]